MVKQATGDGTAPAEAGVRRVKVLTPKTPKKPAQRVKNKTTTLKTTLPKVARTVETTRPILPLSHIGSPPGLASRIVNGGATVVDRPAPREEEERTYETEEDDDEDPTLSQEMASEEEDQGIDLEMESASDEEEEEEDDSDASQSDSESESGSSSDDDDDFDPIDSMKIPFNALSIGKSFAGKTKLCGEFLKRRGEEFSDIFTVCGSKNKDIESYATSDKHKLGTLTEEFLEDFLKFQKEHKQQTALFCDDFLGNGFNFKASPAFKALVSHGRQEGVTLWLMIQDWTELLPLMRRNSGYYFLGNMRANVADSVATELATASVPKKQLVKQLADINHRNNRKHKELYFIDDERSRQKLQVTYDKKTGVQF